MIYGMIYGILRWITGIAIHWFYSEIRVLGRERIPTNGPLLIAVNHQNALVDSLIVGWVVPRRVAMTAKATLVDNPLIAFLFRVLNVVPLRRVSDEARKSGGSPIDRSRNREAFREIGKLLDGGGAVLLFPEGKSHNESGLEPLKTGLARLALQARDDHSIKGVQILPVGLIFEAKGTPGTVVGVRVGSAIEMDTWIGTDHTDLTEQIANRLRAVSEEAGLPPQQPGVGQPVRHSLRERLIALAAWWGRLTHRTPVRIARNIAVRRSTNADEPAMLTILFGVGLVLLTYVVQITIVGAIAHSILIGSIYLLGLLAGAYWAAFERHPRPY
jgi:1-acyl-sn-glycerol-3-phosphate acyltransferase